jgi:hypothetical protein
MMKRNIKYSLVLSATLALSFCQGRQSNIFDPLNGANRLTSEQYAMGTQSVQTNESTRSQRYSLNYTQQQADACRATYQETKALNEFCTQVMYDIYFRFYGPGFENFIPDNTQIQAGNNSMEFDWRSAFNPQANSSWMPQYQQYAGGMNPQAAGYYQTPYNMQQVCGDPAAVTTFQYRSPCGAMGWNQTVIAVNSNNGLNYMRQGDFNRAAGVFGPGGFMQQRAPRLYGTVLSRRNVGKENAEVSKHVEASWTNMKQLPKNWGLRIANSAMDRVAAMGERAVTGVTAPLTIAAANDYAMAGYNQQMADQYYAQATAQYSAALEMSQYNTLAAMQPENPCPQDKFYYRIGEEPATDSQYRVIDCQE